MIRIHSASALVFLATLLYAGEPQQQFFSRYAIQQDLFASNHSLYNHSGLDLRYQGGMGEKKSVGLAVLYSLLIPGLGEHYAEEYGSGKYFSIAEAALWVTYITFDVYGTSLKDDAIRFAVANAGINPIGKDDQFFVDVGNFLNTAEFDEKRNREREPQRAYGNRPGYSWDWGPAELPQSDINRALYKEQRLSGENMLNNRKFVVAAIVINHIASAINAARVAISHNKDLSNPLGEYQIKAGVLGGLSQPHGLIFTVSKNF